MLFIFFAIGLPNPGSVMAETPLAVEFVPVQLADLSDEAALTGTLEARDSVELGFRQGGRVVEVMVEEGDQVTAGQALARTDPVQQDQALLVAEASLASAEATRAQAQQAFDRSRAMLERGVGTRAARDQAQQALSQAEGAVRSANSQVDQARRAVDDTVLRARAASVVTGRNADPGQIVGAAQPVVSLAAFGGFEAVFQTPDLPNLDDAMGARVELHPIDIDAPDMVGKVSEIAPLVDPQYGTVTLRAEVEGVPTNTRLLGTAVRGTVRFPVKSAISVPWTTLTRSGADPAVWLVGEDGTVSLAPVVIERFSNGAVFVGSGLEEGQVVVGAGSQMLYPGRAVVDAALNAETPETNP
ncbi:efflux RND transporter periplasmic adaptor subunit [Paracoccus tegillarcae]|uniref:efflux RND transporter periplasmic adaptor subunit n=1 Tax=Paracoccus tegillarcae TaxID=1529068 RepID=UPI001E5B4161|nr:efflux RND transporter periplasmic adaptor subunit [Paracoccus tegillarcae]